MAAPINVRSDRKLSEYTRRHTQFENWPELLRACRDGEHAPILLLGDAEQVALGIALESHSCEVTWCDGAVTQTRFGPIGTPVTL